MKEETIDGIVINDGIIEGKLVFITKSADLKKVNKDTIVVLNNCGKSISLEAINLGKCAISAQMSITSHLSLNLSSKTPYVIAPDILLLENGAYYKIKINEIAKLDSEMLRFVDRKKGIDVECNGGKGSKLLLLKEIENINVPYFKIISIQDVCIKIYSSNEFKCFINSINDNEINLVIYKSLIDFLINKMTIEIINTSTFESDKLYAVRSSGLDEDGEQQALAGYFESFLNIKVDQINLSVRKVIASVFKEKELVGKQVVFLRYIANLPKIAIVIQEMVMYPLFSGTFFSHMANDKPYPIINAVHNNYADKLMDSKVDSDITVSAFVKNNDFDKVKVIEGKSIVDENLIITVFKEAIKIYKELGYGDLEFVVDTLGVVNWVQARPLIIEVAKYPICELVDRKGFDTKAIEYYKKLAANVCVANNTNELKIKIFNVTDSIFGYDYNIRKRDDLFHEKIKEDISFLEKVTEYGWLIESNIKKLLNEVEKGVFYIDDVKEKLFELLISHGAVQLPFSIPTDGLKDRHKSYPLDTEKEEVKYFDALAQKWIEQANITEFKIGKDLINYLREPIEKNWRVMQYNEKKKLIDSGKEISYLDCYSIILFEFRDLPYFNENLELAIHDSKNDQLFKDIKYADALILTAKELREKNIKPILLEPNLTDRRNIVLTKLYSSLPKNCITNLEYVEKYLLMKGETNETHSFYRGKVFLLLEMNKTIE